MKSKFIPKNGWFIITDGIDCSGKTTFIKEWNKATNYSTWIVDRSTISVKAYARKFYRDIPHLHDLEEHISRYPFTLTIRFIASKEDTIKRQNLKDDGYNTLDYDKDMELFNDETMWSGYHKLITLNSSKLSINKEIKIIKDYISKFEKLNREQERLLK